MAKAFARDFCKAKAADSPKRYLIKIAKKERAGRFLRDYFRNARMATAVAPVSPRGRSGAPVSMPLGWSQVQKGLDPAKFTVRTVPAQLARLSPWETYCESERPLAEAIRQLGSVG